MASQRSVGPVADDVERTSLVRRWREQGYYRGRTFPDELSAAAEQHGAVGVTFVTGATRTTLTVRQLHERAVRAAGALQSLGVRPGDTVAVQVPNWAEGVVAAEAVLLAGAVLVPIVHIYGVREVEFILNESDASVLVMPDRWRSTNYLERIPRLREVSSLRDIVVVGDEVPADAIAWESLERSDAAYRPVEQDPDEVCLLVYTSGATAEPKGVQHTHESILAELRTQPHILGAGDNEVQLATFPAGHIAGMLNVLRPLVLGTPTVVLDSWDAERAAALIAEHQVTVTAGSPFHLASLLDAAERTGASLASLCELLVGAATVPSELVGRAQNHGIVTFRSYGSTEHPTVSCGTVTDALHNRQHTDGRPAPGTEVRIVNQDGLPQPTGVDGEVLCRGPELFVGYRNGALDADVLLPGGWFRTGDIGRLDHDGYLTITDRIKDVIIRGGETISSREVEDILLAHPGIADAAAVAEPDARYGDRVCAFIVTHDRPGPDLESVREHFIASGGAKQKTPERVEIVDELPRTALGKVRKPELRDQLRD